MHNTQAILKTLDKIGEAAYHYITKEDISKEEYAFYLGTINTVTSVLTACDETGEFQGGGVCLNYTKVKEKFEEARAELKKEKEEILANQISIEELFPKIVEVLDKYFEEKKSKPKTKKE